MKCTVKVDSTQFSHIAYCTCGWRQAASSRTSAWEAGAAHQQRSGLWYDHANAARVAEKRRIRGLK